MSRRLLIALAVLLFSGVAAWGAWTIAAHRAEAKAQQLYAEIARHSGARLEAERQRAEKEAALLETRAELAAANANAEAAAASHQQVVTQIRARLRALGQQLETARSPEQPETPALELGLEAPPGLTLEDAWSGWRSCEATLGAMLTARNRCQETVTAQADLLESSRRVEEELRAEVAARQDLEKQLRAAAGRRKWKHRLEGVGLYLAGVGSAKLLGLPD